MKLCPARAVERASKMQEVILRTVMEEILRGRATEIIVISEQGSWTVLSKFLLKDASEQY
jgi:hypothetical protein